MYLAVQHMSIAQSVLQLVLLHIQLGSCSVAVAGQVLSLLFAVWVVMLRLVSVCEECEGCVVCRSKGRAIATEFMMQWGVTLPHKQQGVFLVADCVPVDAMVDWQWGGQWTLGRY